ncbi:hypothetical protein D9611_012404 [Ephemerocybe angulata]|uniref:Uncharacterized protein n=1 Tax=Ephemerocybe angulata TaxID=980116 RepID=A0A8H5CGD4_9AGAR|nr:hypothetical protein D9611_012404 [Tulosesus angulatus]
MLGSWTPSFSTASPSSASNLRQEKHSDPQMKPTRSGQPSRRKQSFLCDSTNTAHSHVSADGFPVPVQSSDALLKYGVAQLQSSRTPPSRSLSSPNPSVAQLHFSRPPPPRSLSSPNPSIYPTKRTRFEENGEIHEVDEEPLEKSDCMQRRLGNVTVNAHGPGYPAHAMPGWNLTVDPLGMAYGFDHLAGLPLNGNMPWTGGPWYGSAVMTPQSGY